MAHPQTPIQCKFCGFLSHVVLEEGRYMVYCVACQETYYLKTQHLLPALTAQPQGRAEKLPKQNQQLPLPIYA